MTEPVESDDQLLEAGLDRLRGFLGESYRVAPYNVANADDGGPTPTSTHPGADVVVSVQDLATGTHVPILVEAKRQLTPSEARRILAPRVDLMRRLMGRAAVLVVSPWLSPRTRGVLDDHGYGYLDLTGNVSFRLNRPAVLLRLQGAQRDPTPRNQGRRSLAGVRAARLVRLLVDVAPPYRATELAEKAGLSPPYVSRLLEVMDDQALILRRGRSIVEVDWVALLRERAAQSRLLRADSYVEMLAPQGTRSTLDRLRDNPELLHETVVTGSVAAAAVAPLAVGGQLMLYVPSHVNTPDRVGRSLGLLPTERAADVLLVRAGDDVVFARSRLVAGVRHVALSQLALDCLGGSGRMPAEGEAVLEYMKANVDQWRLDDVSQA